MTAEELPVEDDLEQPKHDEVDLSAPAVEGPSSDPFNITVSVPEEIDVKLVSADALEEYEVWFAFSSVVAAAVVGFLVPLLQSIGQPGGPKWSLLAAAAVLAVMLGVTVTMTVRRRSQLRRKSKTIRIGGSR